MAKLFKQSILEMLASGTEVEDYTIMNRYKLKDLNGTELIFEHEGKYYLSWAPEVFKGTNGMLKCPEMHRIFRVKENESCEGECIGGHE